MRFFLFFIFSFFKIFLLISNEKHIDVIDAARNNLIENQGFYPDSLSPSIRWKRQLNAINTFIINNVNFEDLIRFSQTPGCPGFDCRTKISNRLLA